MMESIVSGAVFGFVLLVGYIIGVLQKGINITINNTDNEVPEEYNKSVGVDEYM